MMKNVDIHCRPCSCREKITYGFLRGRAKEDFCSLVKVHNQCASLAGSTITKEED